jgi:DNA invertase Pin-like site-specific DNA recombinase
MRICLYARVSKAIEQNPENQLIELRRWAAASGHTIIGEFIDEVSSKDTRPKKEEVLKLMRTGVADGVCFVALDRWGRTMSELVMELEEFSKTEKALISLKEGLDLSSAAGRLMGNILASMANFERDRIKERTHSGLSRARSQGKILGRHPVGCGCGFRSFDGKVNHNGSVKPIRDEHHKVVGWKNVSDMQPVQAQETPVPGM